MSDCCAPLTIGNAAACAPSKYCPQPGVAFDNGDLCSTDADCISANCAPNLAGERHCYGTAERNEVCTDSFDCNTGACLRESLDVSRSVCTPAAIICVERNISDDCMIFYFAYCAFLHSCDQVSDGLTRAKEDHDFCVEALCTTSDPADDPAECRSLTEHVVSGDADCPSD